MGYYEIMKNKFNRQLPPPKRLAIKSIRIHSIAGEPPADETKPLFLLCSILLCLVFEVWAKEMAAT